MLAEIPPDVQKVLEEMALEEEEPDEDTLEVLEDIWLKAGEMGERKYIFTHNVVYEDSSVNEQNTTLINVFTAIINSI